MLTSDLFPQKLRNSIKPARGMQYRDAKRMDDKEMVRDRMVISTTAGLRVTISSIALVNPAAISSNAFHLDLRCST
jgi:hypothetical protein